ncbi:MAG: hypothetical protein ACK5MN_00470 [Lachnospiraceae bacterium]
MKWILQRIKSQAVSMRAHRNFNIILFLTVLVIGFTFFFTSRVWMPEAKDYVTATPYYNILPYSGYEVTLLSWETDDKSERMEVILELKNREILDGTWTAEAVTRKNRDLKTDIVYKESKFLVIHIEQIQAVEEISLRLFGNDSEQPLKVYGNVDSWGHTGSIPEQRKDNEYQLLRIDALIKAEEAGIAAKEAKIEEAEQYNEKIRKKIKELQTEEHLTAEEREENAQSIQDAEGQIKINKEEIKSSQTDIESLEQKIEAIKQQREELAV